MFKVSLFTAIVLFWVSISVALVQMQLTASSAHQLRISAQRSSILMRSGDIAQIRLATAATDFNR